jgi:hypothetical protein
MHTFGHIVLGYVLGLATPYVLVLLAFMFGHE